MSNLLNISTQDVLSYLKMSCQLPGIIDAIATRQIILNKSIEVGLKNESEEIQAAADSLRLANKLLKAEDTWTWLKQHYLSLDDFEQLAQTNLLSNKLAIHLFAEQVEPFFYQNQAAYVGAVTYEVTLEDEDLALELFYAVQEGEISFPDIAREYIENPEQRRAGGYQGIKRRHDFRAEVAAAVFAANPPQILKPIVTPKGVNLIWVEEIIQPQLDELLRTQILADLFTEWLKQEREKLEIEMQLDINEDTQPQMSQHNTSKVA